MTRLLATGRDGTIGRHLSSHIKVLDLDLLRFSEFKEDLSDCTIIHLASRVGVEEVRRNPQISHAVNVDGTLQLAEKAIHDGCNRFVFISTSHVYAPRNEPLRETDVLSPINEYAQQKYEAEIGLLNLFSRSSSQLVILRVFSILGLNTNSNTLGGAVNRIIHGDESVIINYSSDERDFLTPEQAAFAIESLSKEINLSDGILNVCTGKSISVESGVKKIVRAEHIGLLKSRVVRGNSQNPVIVGNKEKLSQYLDLKSQFIE
jgi:nucleoside-diphosphate-sugar epimerase